MNNNLRQLPVDARKTIVDIVARSNNDPEFSRQLSAHPLDTLTAAGLTVSNAEQVLSYNPTEDAAGDEVEGYMGCKDGTCWFIDWSSICPGTCFVSFH
jgi:hypothetical protein